MNNIFFKIKIFALLLSVLCIGSCKNFLDVRPENSIETNKALETLDDFEDATLGIYSIAYSANFYGDTYTLIGDILADNANPGLAALGQYFQEYRWTYTPASAAGSPQLGMWAAMYSTINRANIVIKEIQRLEFENQEDLARANQLLGEALMLRAMSHFALVNYYAKPYKATENASHLGIPIMLESKIDQPLRNTVAEVYAQIRKDLDDASLYMTESSPDRTRLTSMAAIAMLSRVSLYMEEWQDAVDYATQVIENGNYSLASINNFQDMWNTSVEDINEVIFKFGVVPGTGNSIGSTLWRKSAVVDVAEWVPSNNLLSIYDEDNDVRYSSYYIVRDGQESVVKKYQGVADPLDPANPGDGIVDIIVLRLAEIYLIRAEANLMLQNVPQARQDLISLRVNRINNYDPDASGDDILEEEALRNAIYSERRKELAFEGHRWLDLRRRGEAVVRAAGANPANLASDSHKFTWPIPQEEIFANDNMVQNEGY